MIRILSNAARIAGVVTVCCVAAFAHDVLPAPKYRGYVVEAQEIFFEIVPGQDQILVYVEDDSTPLPTADMTGQLRFELGGERRTIPLAPAGANRLVAQVHKPPRGTPIDIDIVLGPNDRIPLRFVMR